MGMSVGGKREGDHSVKVPAPLWQSCNNLRGGWVYLLCPITEYNITVAQLTSSIFMSW